jgi:cell division protein FtsA
MTNHEIIVGLDIGTTKICAIVGKVNPFGKVEVIGLGRAESLGVSRGVVANIDKTVEAIKLAVEQAERSSGIKFTDVYVGIAGQHIKSLQRRGILARDNQEEVISQEDITKLKNDMFKMALPPGDKIIHVLPQEYIVDSEPNIKDPIGMFGFRLEANFHIITGHITAAQNIYRCVQKAGLNVMDLILEPLASSSSVLSEEEKEAGVALIDIGGGTTDIAIFHDNVIRHTAVIPFGGNIISDDIKEAFGIMKNQSEKLKIKFGCAYPNSVNENEFVTIPGLSGRNSKEVSKRNLANVIHARLEEIMEYAYFQIKSSGYEKKLIGGIVLTGGGSKMNGLKPMVESLTGIEARVGYPTPNLTGTKVKDIAHPGYATGIGLIVRGYEDFINKTAIESGKPEEVIKIDNAPEIEVEPIMHAQEMTDEENKDATGTDETKEKEGVKRKIIRWWERLIDKTTDFIEEGANSDTELK